MYVAGIDAGSRAIKIVLLDKTSLQIKASGVVDQGVEQEDLVEALFNQLLHGQGVTRADVGRVVATGYGRNRIAFADTTITEITCHAHGVRHVAPGTMTILEIGGQDSKLIRLDRNGLVRDFAMNDRCAAGTGRFLEVVATRLAIPLAELGLAAARSQHPAQISSTCVVFAETEIVGLLAQRTPPEDIAAGMQTSLARRVAALAGRTVEPPVCLTGGVALIPGMAEAMQHVLNHPVTVAPHPQLTGALGAALLAIRHKE